MEMSPQRVRGAEFKTARKGADLDEVRAFLNDVADELERAQNQSTAMEARARAAVARLQEVGEGPAAAPAPATPTVDVSVDESETISRTLLLAQRTADTTVAAAKREADGILQSARDEAATTRDSTREMASQMLDEARMSARQAGEAERLAIAGEVDALKARRDFLESDVEQLEIFMADQRNRVRDAATSLLDVADRVPGGLGEVRTPLLSASDDAEGAVLASLSPDGADEVVVDDDAEEHPRPSPVETLDDVDDEVDDEVDGDDDDESLLIVTDLAESNPGDDRGDNPSDPGDDTAGALDVDPWSDRDEPIDPRDEPTAAMPVIESARPTSDDSDGFRFSFDDNDR